MALVDFLLAWSDNVIRWIGLKVVPMDRWHVSSVPGADFLLKIITPSCWTIEKTTRSVSHLAVTYKLLSVNRRFFHQWVGKLWAVQAVSISSNATPMIDFSSVSECLLNSASVKYHTGGTYSIGSVRAVIAAHLPEDSACGMSHTYCWSSVIAAAIFKKMMVRWISSSGKCNA